MNFCDQWAGGVKHGQAACGRFLLDGTRDAVGTEHGDRKRWHLRQVLDENRPLVLQTLDDVANSSTEFRLRGARIALQEYGVSNAELIASLTERGAVVTRVPVYQWALPEDVAPLQSAIKELAAGKIDVVLFTTGIQAAHLFEVAKEMKLEDAMRQGLRRAIVASIGPTTSEELQRHGIQPDLEPSHPKMGFLVKETAEQAAALLSKKRQGSASA